MEKGNEKLTLQLEEKASTVTTFDRKKLDVRTEKQRQTDRLLHINADQLLELHRIADRLSSVSRSSESRLQDYEQQERVMLADIHPAMLDIA